MNAEFIEKYNAARTNWQPQGAPAVTASGAPAAFWNRQLKHFNPLNLFTSETRSRAKVYWTNHANYHLLRPKGILTTSLVYGGAGWLVTVVYKQRYHRYYEYF